MKNLTFFDSYSTAIKLLIIFSILIVVSSCGSPVTPVLGSTMNFENYKVLSQVEINSLKVRVASVYADAYLKEGCRDGERQQIEISGPIGPDTSEVLERILQKIEKCRGAGPLVFLNSKGGLLNDGYKLGQTFKKYQVTTVITRGQLCASSCAIAFLGGRARWMYGNSLLVFHAPYTQTGSSIECIRKSESQDMKVYFNNFLGTKSGDFLFERTMSFCSKSEGWVINSDAAALLDITTK